MVFLFSAPAPNGSMRDEAQRTSRFGSWQMVDYPGGQRMEPEIFLGRFFRVRVEDATDIHGNPLPEAQRYSKIVEFLECIGP